MLPQIKAQFFTETVLNPPVNGRIQGLFKASEGFSSTFQGKFKSQGLFKTVLYSSAYQACADPELYVYFTCHYESMTLEV